MASKLRESGSNRPTKKSSLTARETRQKVLSNNNFFYLGSDYGEFDPGSG